MGNESPTVVIAQLDDEKLRKSIDSLVSYVNEQFNSMVSTTNQKVSAMQQELMKLNDFKFDNKTTTDNGNTARTKANQTEKQSVADLQNEYYKLLGALQMATRQSPLLQEKWKKSLSTEDLIEYGNNLKRISELQKSLDSMRGKMTYATIEKQGQFTPNMKEYADGLIRTNDELKKLNASFKEMEKDSQRAFRVGLANAMKLPTNNIDEIRYKWAELHSLVNNKEALQVFTPAQIANAKQALDEVWGMLQRHRTLQEQINADSQQQIEQTNQLAEAEKRYGAEIAQAAQDYRDLAGNMNAVTLEGKNGSFRLVNPTYNPEAKSLEEQLVAYKNLNQEADIRLNVLKAIEVEEQKSVQAAAESLDLTRKLKEEREAQANKKLAFAEYDDLQAAIASVIGVKKQEVNIADIETASYKELAATLAQLKQAYNSLNKSDRKSDQGKWLIDNMQDVQRAIQMIQSEARQPMNLDKIIRLPEKTIDDITYKVQMLRSYISGLDTVEQHDDIRKVLDIIEKLNEKAKETQKSTRQVFEDINKISFDKISKMPEGNFNEIGAKIKELEEHLTRLRSQPIYDEKAQRRTEDALDRLKAKYDKLKSQQGTEANVDAALNKTARTLDEIAQKIQLIQAVRSNLDVEKQKDLIDKLNASLRELLKKQDDILGKNNMLKQSNDVLSRSWNYMRNRLAFYFTVGASTQFVKQLIEIRGQYEMLERSIGVLADSAERGSEMFAQLNAMALNSPFTTIELGNAARQLMAYDVAAKDVVDTTRRLADITAATGSSIERLAYALGHVQTYGYLNSLQSRQFTNSGVPIVKELAKMYTELEGRMVSTAEVYDRMKKKAVGYADVQAVIMRMTDESGRFFDYQAKMADTLKVQLANLNLAWNNMLNDIGKSNQGILSAGIKLLRQMFLAWKSVDKAILTAAVSIGTFIVAQRIAEIGTKKHTFAMFAQAVAGKKLTAYFTNLRAAMIQGAAAINPYVLALTALVAVGTSVVITWKRAVDAMHELNEEIAKSAKDDVRRIDELLKDMDVNNLSDVDAARAWERIREELELTTAVGEKYVGVLLEEENANERVKKSIDYLQKIRNVQSALSDIDNTSIKVGQEWSSWWNLWEGSDGLINNIKDYNNQLDDTKDFVDKLFDKFITWDEKGFSFGSDAAMKFDKKQYIDDLTETIRSINETVVKEGFSGEEANIAFDKLLHSILSRSGLTAKEMTRTRIDAERLRYNEEKKMVDDRYAHEKKELDYISQYFGKSHHAYQEQYDKLSYWEQRKQDLENSNREQEILFDEFSQYLIRNNRSMLDKMSKDGVDKMDFTSSEWETLLGESIKSFEGDYKISLGNLENELKDPERWRLVIRTVIRQEELKSEFDTLTELDKKADEAWSKIQRLTTRRDELRKKGASHQGTSDEDKEYAKTLDELVQAQKDYNDALAKGGHSKKEDKKSAKERKEAESELQRALKEELTLLDKVRSAYKSLTKEGVDSATAIDTATSGYEETVKSINNTLSKFGITPLDLTKYAGVSNPRDVMDMLQAQLNKLVKSGLAKPAEIKDLQVKLKDLQVESMTFDQNTITNSLNNELSKIKDEYELAVELDADPELGDMFSQMFGIDTDVLPQTFGEAFDKANETAKKKLEEMKVDVSDFDLMGTLLKSDEKGEWKGIDVESEFMKDLIKWQEIFRDMFKKNLTDTEKMLDDYVKKYGNYSDKIAEIESDRLEKIAQLNNAYYNEEMRRRPEYSAKMNAIEQGARREKGNARFDEFKNSRLYVQMFENLRYVSTATLETMKTKLNDLQGEMGKLKPEQVKEIAQQFEKIESEMIRRNPFKNATKNAKEYLKAIGRAGKQAEENFITAQQNYDAQLNLVATLKEQLENAKRQGENGKAQVELLNAEIEIEDDKLKMLREELELAGQINQQYDLTRKLFTEQAKAMTSLITSNVSSLSELRDTLWSFGINLGDDMDAVIDDLSKASEGVNQTMSSLQSGNVVGAVSGVVKTVGGIGDAIASVFGDGAARTKRINREINRSKESVRQLEMAYKDLQKAVELASGSEETRARREQIANKEAELAEIERQKALEESKRSKDRDAGVIKQYEETMQDLRMEIDDLKRDVVDNLLGEDVKSAAEEFVDAWVQAWRAGETTLDAIDKKMDEVVFNLIKKAATSRIVSNLLNPLYETVDAFSKEESEGGMDFTTGELAALAALSKELGVKINDALGAFYGNLANLGIIAQSIEDNKELSALQQGIQGITEDTAGALEAYMNSVSQQVYLHSDLLTQIRDVVVTLDFDMQTSVMSQMLLQLQSSYQVQMSIQNILLGVLNPSGMAMRVELAS